MNPLEAKREMLHEIRRMAGEARMKHLKGKYAPPPAAQELPAEVLDDERPPSEGEHEPLSDEDLAALLED